MPSFQIVVAEGLLEEPVALRLLRAAGDRSIGLNVIRKHGSGDFWSSVVRYDQAAPHVGPILALADLDRAPCPSGLIQRFCRRPPHRDLVLRIAVRSLESWLLADEGIATFLGVPATRLPRRPDMEDNPKRTLVNLARQSTRSRIKESIVPEPETCGLVARGYLACMTKFVKFDWNPLRARSRSSSLDRALRAVENVLDR